MVPKSAIDFFQSAIAKEKGSFARVAAAAQASADPKARRLHNQLALEELLSLLDGLRADEEHHLRRLHQLLEEPVRAEPALPAQRSH